MMWQSRFLNRLQKARLLHCARNGTLRDLYETIKIIIKDYTTGKINLDSVAFKEELFGAVEVCFYRTDAFVGLLADFLDTHPLKMFFQEYILAVGRKLFKALVAKRYIFLVLHFGEWG